jgi:hypothetical protein
VAATGLAIKHSLGQSHPVYFTSLFMFLCLIYLFDGANDTCVAGIWWWKDSVFHAAIFAFQVKLMPFNPEVLDESVLWTESKDMGKGFRSSAW